MRAQAHLEGGHLPVPKGHGLPRGRQAGVEGEPVDSRLPLFFTLRCTQCLGSLGTNEEWRRGTITRAGIPWTLQQPSLCSTGWSELSLISGSSPALALFLYTDQPTCA